ncbi:MAG: hypothetical protein JXR83_18275 [Deltaproteobacteria bacterium]|nr:hypothetical protein [Deltaproteobacteria bacterium]
MTRRNDRRTLASGERVAAAARRLRARPGWNPRPSAADAGQELAVRLGEIRAAAAYEQSADCPACAEARRDGDPDALCADHLAQALGLDPR